MAKDVIRLLKNSNAIVDPNLISLVPEEDRLIDETHQKRKRRRRREKQTVENAESEIDEPVINANEFDSDEQEFASLNPNRIILKRASHVSEAESDSDD